jgi:hypothetical protein
LHGIYLFGGFTRRIVARFGRGEMERFIVCCLFGAKRPEITVSAGRACGSRFGGDVGSRCLSVADSLKPIAH